MNIKELRETTGQTQKEFADRFGIPVGTLRRWEYGESTPAPYIVSMIAEKLPENKKGLQIFKSSDDVFYYDNMTNSLIDEKGTHIKVKEKIEGVKEQNLVNYAKDLFEAYYEAVSKFDTDCRLDKKEDILWG